MDNYTGATPHRRRFYEVWPAGSATSASSSGFRFNDEWRVKVNQGQPPQQTYTCTQSFGTGVSRQEDARRTSHIHFRVFLLALGQCPSIYSTILRPLYSVLSLVKATILFSGSKRQNQKPVTRIWTSTGTTVHRSPFTDISDRTQRHWTKTAIHENLDTSKSSRTSGLHSLHWLKVQFISFPSLLPPADTHQIYLYPGTACFYSPFTHA